jgi:hypothetical protein
MFDALYGDNNETEQAHLSSLGDQLVAQGLPQMAGNASLGELWLGLGSAANALTAAPTTTAQLALWNGEWGMPGAKSYAPVLVGYAVTTALAAAVNLQLFVQVSTTAVAAQTSLLTPKSISGRRNYRGMGGHKASVTVTADAWHPVCGSPSSQLFGGGGVISANATANIRLEQTQLVYGRYVIPPGGVFGICAVVNSGTVSCTPFVVWAEINTIHG